jgi:hypothetical protein
LSGTNNKQDETDEGHKHGNQDYKDKACPYEACFRGIFGIDILVSSVFVSDHPIQSIGIKHCKFRACFSFSESLEKLGGFRVVCSGNQWPFVNAGENKDYETER